MTKIKDKWQNFKAWLILFLIKYMFHPDKRAFIIKWAELKLKIITKEHFDKWVTKEVLG